MRINVVNPVNCWKALKPSCQSGTGNGIRNVLEKLMDIAMGNQQASFSGMRRSFNEQGRIISRPESGPTKTGSVQPMCLEFFKFALQVNG